MNIDIRSLIPVCLIALMILSAEGLLLYGKGVEDGKRTAERTLYINVKTPDQCEYRGVKVNYIRSEHIQLSDRLVLTTFLSETDTPYSNIEQHTSGKLAINPSGWTGEKGEQK